MRNKKLNKIGLTRLGLSLCILCSAVFAPFTYIAAQPDDKSNEPNKYTDVPPNVHSSYHAFAKPVVLIDVGHGGVDGGASHKGILEKDINLAIAQKLYLILRSQGYPAVLNRDKDYALSDDNRWLQSKSRHLKDLAQRKSLTEQLPTALVVSLHVNWTKRAEKRGPIVLYQDEGSSYLLAERIQRSLNRLFCMNRKTVYGKPFYLLNKIQHPAVIVETGFISNEQDRAMLSEDRGQKSIAGAIAEGIIAHLTAW
ncbi:N-acetylmuramoyl-L-alanine amidase [Paenibacillus polymyxa]|uniref:N-acetylmuramoyl-L-alanine amidase n=1 Tax=Paenibacillus polymyxa TaxID=1406 RepID=UPI0004DA26E8|nr:N-acetylmuramoyl-L-alanine amidase [Paenibacillus polymyxa]KEO80720.1 N-acetylmuramoyl-L-alanine amidase [Paenibacillus polymyxa]MCH6186843.1 N-acetylmuramoyl-L-alanine amidase [Paenibacillus polymyxa]MDY8092146.1 N-acetylmuramoyl-L-alanine amidase [Paenibacillus polymyxa]WRL60185.1 N-acetylmuramoyl-L-alanine amidase [Paenibacillus polymyxa]